MENRSGMFFTICIVPTSKTAGESFFESYLYSNDYTFEFEKSKPGAQRRPDYLVHLGQESVYCEVKDIEANNYAIEKHPYPILLEPYPIIREKINSARKKFQEYKDHICCLVLFNRGNLAVDLREPDEMIGAMYGDVGQRYRTNPNTGEILETKSVFISDGKMINQKTGATSNTTISAIISLRRISCSRRLELQPGVIVWENVYAKKPLSRHWFAGRYDARYARVNNYQLLVYAGLEMGRCFEGLSHRGEE